MAPGRRMCIIIAILMMVKETCIQGKEEKVQRLIYIPGPKDCSAPRTAPELIRGHRVFRVGVSLPCRSTAWSATALSSSPNGPTDAGNAHLFNFCQAGGLKRSPAVYFVFFYAIRRGEGAQRKRCRDPRCSPRYKYGSRVIATDNMGLKPRIFTI